MPTWWAKARKSNKKVPAAMRQFLSSDATNVATAAKTAAKQLKTQDFFQIQRMKLKLAQGLLNQLHSIIDLTGLEK